MKNQALKQFAPVPAEVECMAKIMLDAAFHVHTSLEPGFCEPS